MTSSQSAADVSTPNIKEGLRTKAGRGTNILHCLSHKHCFDIIAALRVPEVESEPLLIGLNAPPRRRFAPSEQSLENTLAAGSRRIKCKHHCSGSYSTAPNGVMCLSFAFAKRR